MAKRKRLIPESVIAQGAPTVYGWVAHHAWQAERLGYSRFYQRYEAARRTGADRAGITPESEPLIRLCRRLYRLEARVRPMLGLHGGRYLPWPGAVRSVIGPWRLPLPG
jgi:hypothetical protein